MNPRNQPTISAAARRGQANSGVSPFRRSPLAAALVAGLALLAGGNAVAQQAAAPNAAEANALEAVTVRGRPKIEKLKEVPVSVAVVSGAELDRELAADLGSITKRASSVSYNQSNTRGGSLSIRGLGKRGFTETQDPSVLLTVDGVSYGLTQLGNFDFYDVDSVEVYRGPQGTRGGKGATAGELVVNSKQPSFAPTADYQLTYGQRDTVIAKAALGGTIIEDLLAWRSSFSVNKGRGYYSNTSNDRGSYSLYNKDRISGRAQFLLTPSSDFKALFSIDIEPHTTQLQNGLSNYVDTPLRYADGTLVDKTGTSVRSLLNGFTDANGVSHSARSWFANRGLTYANYLNQPVRSGSVSFDRTEGQYVSNKGGSLKLDWDTGSHTVTSITGFRNYTFDARNDEGTVFDVAKFGGGGVYYNQLSQEVKIANQPGGFVDYVAGLYALTTRDTVESHAGFGNDAGAWYANITQYERLDTNAGTNRGAGLALLRDSLDDLYTISRNNIRTRSTAIYGNATWHLTDDLGLNTGLRIGQEKRHSETWAWVANNGVGSALNPASTQYGLKLANGGALGGFALDSSNNLTAANSAAQTAVADSVAQRYYGVSTYSSLTAAQKAQVAAAKAIRLARINGLYSGVAGDYKDRVLPTAVVSPTYKFNENFTGYVSWQYGEKSGSVLQVNNHDTTVKPERTNDFELGFKSVLLDRTLTLNANLFLMNIRDYQQTVVAVDEFQTAQQGSTQYVSVQGNAEKVQSKGIEIDGVYSGLRNTQLRVSASYNDAKYKRFTNAGKPSELNYLSAVFVDQSGKALAGAPKLLVNVGGEYRQPIYGDKVAHVSVNTAFTTRYNNDESLSDFTWVGAHSTTDLSFGVGTARKGFDASIVVRNLFDDRSHEKGWSSYEPNPYPRWVGLVLSGSL
ncbi:TonB-dependent receptor [Derxia lacustris]|uniref:TonB-dependent receptor n=1 Tax=Derxia lacustris TaxID=764842 RepID=UPI001F158994|nr:TonB-dependent receptor plug domain-containing protein [Derxia lacustris]